MTGQLAQQTQNFNLEPELRTHRMPNDDNELTCGGMVPLRRLKLNFLRHQAINTKQTQQLFCILQLSEFRCEFQCGRQFTSQ
jgi:hypothetical protein